MYIWDFIKNNAGAVTAIASILGLFGIYILWLQVRLFSRWNKIEATFTYFPNPLELEKLENELDEAIYFWSRDQALSEAEVKGLMKPKELTSREREILKESYEKKHISDEQFDRELKMAGRKLKLFLNELEGYCTAINVGAVHGKTAKLMYDLKFKHHYNIALPFIEALRTRYHDRDIYSELRTIVSKWSPPEERDKIV